MLTWYSPPPKCQKHAEREIGPQLMPVDERLVGDELGGVPPVRDDRLEGLPALSVN